MQHWFDPIAIAIVFLGTLAAAVLRCGLVDARFALATLRSLTQPAFDPVKAKAEVAKQLNDIATDGFLRAEAHQFGDTEFDRLAEIMISQRSAESLHGEHTKYRLRRADVANRATRFLDCAAELAPVMGLAGTLIALGSARGGAVVTEAVAGAPASGLVDSIAMAVVTTLYGLLAANFLFAPLSNAVQRRARAEERDRDAVLDWLEKGVRRIDKGAAPLDRKSDTEPVKGSEAKAA